ncbi:MAG: hypothetical protein RLY86_1439 [Pseudomonadota bacterium]|jgi:arabinogalactan oligomer/maltooligosaccharide transport system substrate-binding protein
MMSLLRPLLLPLLLLLSLLGAGPVRAQPVELLLWHAYRGQEMAALDTAVALFNDRHGDRIRVKAVPTPYDGFADKISAAIPQGTGPDLFIFSHDRLGGWVEAGGIVEPVDFWLTPDLRDRFLSKTMPAMRYRGQTFGLPFKFAAIAMVYNAAKVPNPPRTTTELLDWARANTDSSIGRYGWAYVYNDVFFHGALMNAFGGGAFDPEAKGTLVDPILTHEGNAKAAELLLSWLNAGVLPSEPNGALVTSLFNAGKTDIIFTGPWFFGEVRPDIDVGIAPMPVVDEAGGEPLRPWMTIEGLFVSASSRHQDAAFEVADFLTMPEVARIMALQGRQLPANRAVYDDPAVAADEILVGYKAQGELAVPMPNLAVMTLMWNPMEAALRKMIKGGATPAQALAEVQTRLQADIDALRKDR